MTEVPGYVLDASIAVKWLIKSDDEPHLEQADRINRDYQNGLINLVSPSVLNYEVGHALTRATRRERITAPQAQALYERFLSWQLPTVYDDQMVMSALALASIARTSFYDSSYLTLASRLRAPLLHADERIRELTDDVLVPAVWIEDYVPESPAR
jgi:predicted nucleic acid-binding protein